MLFVFSRVVAPETSALFSRVPFFLALCLGGLSGLSFGLLFGGAFYLEKTLFWFPESGKIKVLPFLALFSEFCFCYGSFLGEFWGRSSVF